MAEQLAAPERERSSPPGHGASSGSVVCAIDASPASCPAAREAAALARALGSRLISVQVGEAAGASPIDVAADEEAELLVVGLRRRASLRDLVRRSPCPVVAVPQRVLDARIRGSIVCGVSESDGAHLTARVAADLGARLGLRRIVLHAHSPDADATVARAWSLLARVVGELDSGVEGRLVLGAPVQALQAVADRERSLLLAVGAPEAGVVRALLSGSVGAQLAAAASRPVVIVPRGVRRWPRRRP